MTANLKYLIIVLASLALGGGAYLGYNANLSKEKVATFAPTPTPQKKSATIKALKPPAVIFGQRDVSKAYIKAINIDDGSDIILAVLSTNIKDVHFVSDHEIFYIGRLDNREFGEGIFSYDLLTGEERPIVGMENGWMIDDYVLSRDKSWLAWWEVKFAPGASSPLGGQSRVLVKNLQNQALPKIVVINETSTPTDCIHYPMFFDSQNRLFLDCFIPEGGGFYLGLAYTTIPNIAIYPVPGMGQGEFAADPKLDTQAQRLVEVAHEDTNISLQALEAKQLTVKSSDNQGGGIIRPELLSANVLFILNLSDFSKEKILGPSVLDLYSSPIFSTSGQYLFYKKGVKTQQKSQFDGFYRLDLERRESAKIPQVSDEFVQLLYALDDNRYLEGKPEEKESYGSLGENYANLFSSLGTREATSGKYVKLVEGAGLDYITLVDFSISYNPQLAALAEAPHTLKLGTLAKAIPDRPQNDIPREKIPTPPTTGGCQPLPNFPQCACDCVEKVLAKKENPRCAAFYTCFAMECGTSLIPMPPGGKCHDSPLYLYPRKTTQVEVCYQGEGFLFSPKPKTYENNCWQVEAYPDGMLVNYDGKVHWSISYDYFTFFGEKPTRGLVVKKENLTDALFHYAVNLGLNQREQQDFVNYWTGNLPKDKPYIFISHFDRERSKKIIGLTFNPQPDMFIPIVMYFRPLDVPISTEPPVFEPIPKRVGFTAIDWSGVIDSQP